MKKIVVQISFMFSLLFVLYSCDKDASVSKEATVMQATGNIQDKVNEFRHLLGDQLNTTIGLSAGRREINWDGVPDSLAGKALPLDFFNPTTPGAPESRQRGLAYAATGQFQVSSNSFQDINSNAAGQFHAFSGNKVFANVSSKAWQLVMEKAGQHVPAAIQGFGAVFSDVDMPNSTALEFFNGSKSLGKYFVPAHDVTTSFSFLGVYFNNAERITRILVSHDGILTDAQKDISENGPADLVVLDDLLYSEPVAVTP